jgi:iron complex outermembrane receptor protein
MTLKRKLAASAAFIGLAASAGTALADATAAATVDSSAANAAAAPNAGSIVVTAKRDKAPTLVEVPGGTGVITADQIEQSSIANLGDALKFVPGLFAQAVAGGEGTRLSIRGSGITKGGFTWGNGVDILFDGLPLSGPLGTPYESFEPNAYANIQVYKGANAFEYGATQLGGVINFVQHTGYDSSPLFVRLEGGGYGYQREQVSSGQVIGPLDYYFTITHFQTGGYQVNSAATSGRFIGNVGYQITPNLTTRFYFEDARQHQQNVNALTLSQLETDPQLNPYTQNAANPVNGTRVNVGSIFVANKTTYDIDPNSSFELGLGYKKPPLYNGSYQVRTFWDTSDWSASLKYRRKDTLFGDHESDTTVAFLPSAVIGGSGASSILVPSGVVAGHVKYGGSNDTLLISNDFAVTPALWLVTGVANIWQTRTNDIDNPSVAPALAAGTNPSLDKSYSSLTPRIGFRYNLTPQIELYGNVSRLIEAPQVIGYAQSATVPTGPAAGGSYYTGYSTTTNGVTFNARSLKVQSGTSFEIGVKGQTDHLKWDIDYYNEHIHDELLTTYAVLPNTPGYPAAGISYTENASPTVHEGVEASVDAVLWRGDGHTVTLRQAYNWNHFFFVNDGPEQKILPGLPIQSYQAGLNYSHASGVYAAVNIDAVLNHYPVDYANSQFAPAYTLLGATVGYASPDKKWRVFVQGQNLTDRKYASFTSATGLASATSAVYTPGEGRVITAGLSHAFF